MSQKNVNRVLSSSNLVSSAERERERGRERIDSVGEKERGRERFFFQKSFDLFFPLLDKNQS